MTGRRLPSPVALRAFEAVARLGSAKRAADELSVTPTAISHQLRHLEDLLGVALFVRRPRQLVLTAPGRELSAVLRDAFDAVAEVVDRLRDEPRRSITLSATPAVAARWLVPRLSGLSAACPDLDLRLHVSHQPVALDGVTADLAIRFGSGRWPGLVADRLFDNVFAPVCSPLIGLHHVHELPRHTLLHFEPPGAVSAPVDWALWQRQAEVAALDTTAGPVFSDETHTISAALGGQGIALMSLALVADELRAGSLVQPFGPQLRTDAFHLVWPTHRRADRWLMQVREWVLAMPSQAG